MNIVMQMWMCMLNQRWMISKFSPSRTLRLLFHISCWNRLDSDFDRSWNRNVFLAVERGLRLTFYSLPSQGINYSGCLRTDRGALYRPLQLRGPYLLNLGSTLISYQKSWWRCRRVYDVQTARYVILQLRSLFGMETSNRKQKVVPDAGSIMWAQ